MTKGSELAEDCWWLQGPRETAGIHGGSGKPEKVTSTAPFDTYSGCVFLNLFHLFYLHKPQVMSGFVSRSDIVERCCPGWQSALLKAHSSVGKKLQELQVSQKTGNRKYCLIINDNRQK